MWAISDKMAHLSTTPAATSLRVVLPSRPSILLPWSRTPGTFHTLNHYVDFSQGEHIFNILHYSSKKSTWAFVSPRLLQLQLTGFRGKFPYCSFFFFLTALGVMSVKALYPPCLATACNGQLCSPKMNWSLKTTSPSLKAQCPCSSFCCNFSINYGNCGNGSPFWCLVHRNASAENLPRPYLYTHLLGFDIRPDIVWLLN